MKYYIDELKIIGIKNPFIYFSGWVHNDSFIITIKSNKREIIKLKNSIAREDVAKFFNEKNLKNKYGFGQAIKLKNSDKIIKIYLTINHKTIQIAKINNFITLRTLYKINNLLKRIYWKSKLIIKTFLKLCYHIVKCPKMLFNKEFFHYYISGYKYDLETRVLDINNTKTYNKWLLTHDKPTSHKKLNYNPLISVVIPVYNAPKNFLDECINSILNQTYQNFEICLADDASPKPYVKELLQKYELRDKRIKVIYREKNGNISAATNSAISIAKGEFIALVDNDDTLTPNALYENVYALNKNPELDFLYSDEDKLDLEGNRCLPHYKANWSPDTLLSINYITHFAVLRKSIVEKIGGFRTKCDGAQDYDMFLRFTEVIPENHIYHISKVLYNWRMSETSTALSIDSKSYASAAGQTALQDALDRRKIKGIANIFLHTSYYVNYEINKSDKVSIIIPTKDNSKILKKCINSIYKYTSENLFEIIIINNNSTEDVTFKYFDKVKKEHKNISVITINEPFNYSKLNNVGISNAKNDYVLFLNNDIEIQNDGWLETMLGYAKQDHIGAVGVELLYQNQKIQHAGVVLGMGRNKVASHPFMFFDKSYGGSFERIQVPYNYSAVTGACMLVKKDKLLKVDCFDEKLAVSYNDVDLCLKLLDKGYYNVFLPQVKLIHHESLTRGYDDTYEKMYQTFTEIKYIRHKWNKLLLNDNFYNKHYSLHHPFMLNEKKEK